MKLQIKTVTLLIAGLCAFGGVKAQDGAGLEASADTVMASDTISAAEKKIKSAKDYCPHEIGLWFSGGSNNIFYPDGFGEKPLGWGGAFGLGYTWFFHRNWGIGLGAELALYQGRIRVDGLTDSYPTQDPDGHDILYSARFDKYEEVQYLGNVNIPLSFIFQTKTRGENKYYASLAFKLGVPIWDKYGSGNAELTTWGYYPHIDQTLTAQRDLGYGEFKGVGSKGRIPFDLAYMGQFETGFKWRLSPGNYLYTGVYAEYAFNDVVKGDPTDRFVTYDAEDPSNFKTGGVLTSEYRRDGVSAPFTDKVALLGVGVKLKFGFSAGCGSRLETERKAKKAERAAERRERREDTRPERVSDVQVQVQQPIQQQSSALADAQLEAARAYAEAARAAAEQARAEADRAKAERDAYLDEANARRRRFETEVSRPNSRHLRDVDNYKIAVVTLNDVQKRDLDEYIALMLSDESVTVRITGHTCSISAADLNMRIGQERADLAKDYMVERGISPKRIETFSKGETEPLYPNGNWMNRHKNRRLEIELVR